MGNGTMEKITQFKNKSIKYSCVFALVFILTGTISTVKAAISLSPTSVGDGEYTTTTIGGQQVWQNINGDKKLYFKVPSSFAFSVGVPVYVEVNYYDEGRAFINLQYDSQTTSYHSSEIHSRSSRIATNTYVNSYHKLADPLFNHRENNSTDFRLNLSGSDGTPLSVHSVTISTEPFSDPMFATALTKPWESPYSGSSRDDITADTLNHKVLCGYQGWFRCPNDLADSGWVHWSKTSGIIDPTNFHTDMWPDLTEFTESEKFKADDVLTQSGQQAYLFSSVNEDTVKRFFKWMRKYGIDGVYQQRFVSANNYAGNFSGNWSLNFVRKGAHLEGRIWAVEYDVSSLGSTPDLAYQVVTDDWKYLVDTCHITSDSRYAHEGSKPVIAIYGLAHTSKSNLTVDMANSIVDFFKSDPQYGGHYVLGSLPTDWYYGSYAPEWYAHFDKYDGIETWMDKSEYWASEIAYCSSRGIDYYGHIKPGFSWAHMKNLAPDDTSYQDREDGQLFWDRVYGLESLGVTRIFIGMFDEYDESTAIIPMTDDHPNSRSSTQGRFLDNQGMASDWWMLLAQYTGDTLRKYVPLSATKPSTTELSNRSNIGAEATCDLAAADVNNNLSRVSVTVDGNTTADTLFGRNHRYNTNPAVDHYIYFDMYNDFTYRGNSPDVTVEFDYYDTTGNVPIRLQYDSTSSAYKEHPKLFTTQGTNTWRTIRCEIDDAYLGDRQNNNSDFRIYDGSTTQSIRIDRVRVLLPGNVPSPSAASSSLWLFY